MMRKLRLFCYFLLLSFTASLAQWTTDPTGLAVCTADGVQQNVKTISDSAGGAFVVWQDQREDVADIYAQHVGVNGIIKWQQDGVAVVTVEGEQIELQATSNGHGGLIVVWTDKRLGYAGDLYGQRFNRDGENLWQENGKVLVKANDFQGNASVVLCPEDDTFILCWLDYRNDANDPDIYCQKFNLNGDKQWPTDVRIQPVDFIDDIPKLAGDGSGGAYVAWLEKKEREKPFGDTGVYVLRLNNNGLPVWSPERLNRIIFPEAEPGFGDLQLVSGADHDVWIN
jgi:hypothetical protein